MNDPFTPPTSITNPGGNPFTAYAPEMSFLGDVVSAYGQMQEGIATKDAYDYNAQILANQADQVMFAGDFEIGRIEEAGDQLLSTQHAMYAKAGVTQSGSPTDVALQTASNIEMDKMVTNYNTQVHESNLRSQAALDQMYGKQAKQAGQFNAANTLIEGAAMLAFLA